jgi:Uri superfamily endonuclease
MKGSYILLLELVKPQPISIGRLGTLYFAEGFYAYVGSALNGLERRVNRHFKKDKKHHWHIDYLLDRAEIREAILIPTESRLECTLAGALNEELTCIRRFGSSDCHCQGHLFYAPEKDEIKRVKEALAKLSISYYYGLLPETGSFTNNPLYA